MPWWWTGIGTRTCVVLLHSLSSPVRFRPFGTGSLFQTLVLFLVILYSSASCSYRWLVPLRWRSWIWMQRAPVSFSPPGTWQIRVMLAERSTPRARRRRLQARSGFIACRRPLVLPCHGSFVYLSDRHVMCSARTSAATLRDARTSFQQDDSSRGLGFLFLDSGTAVWSSGGK